MESAEPSDPGLAARYQGWLDGSYDEQLRSLDLPWLPWVGARYREQKVRTIVLGESVYDYSAGDASKRAWILRQDSLRIRHLNHAVLARFKSRYVRNFERAYYGKAKPTARERQDLWGGVAYHNLVLRMLRSSKSRPSDEDYAKGWERFLALAACLDAQQVVVYGLEQRKVHALRSLGGRVQVLDAPVAPGVKPVSLTVPTASGPDMRLLFIRHPSAFFRWQAWGRVVQQFCRAAA